MKNPHAVALGKRGGEVASEAKAAAARENGKKGGRPRSRESHAEDRPRKIVRKNARQR